MTNLLNTISVQAAYLLWFQWKMAADSLERRALYMEGGSMENLLKGIFPFLGPRFVGHALISFSFLCVIFGGWLSLIYPSQGWKVWFFGLIIASAGVPSAILGAMLSY